jgi:glyoxylase I family protein
MTVTPRQLHADLKLITGLVDACIDQHIHRDAKTSQRRTLDHVELLVVDEAERLSPLALEHLHQRDNSTAGVHHVCLTVTGIDASMNWYQELFQAGRWPGRLAHYAREETGFAEMLVDTNIGLHHHNANQGETFEERHTGLDHVSFQVADRAALEAWIDRFDELNIGHTGIRRRPNGPYATVVFRDPDNNQLEFAAPMPTDAE